MPTSLRQHFLDLLPAVDFCSLRLVTESGESLEVRQNVIEPPRFWHDSGAMITVIHQGGLGYAATPDLSRSGLRAAIKRACDWAQYSRAHAITDFSTIAMPKPQGHYHTQVQTPWDSYSLRDKLDLLQTLAHQVKIDARITDWRVALDYSRYEQHYFSADGAEAIQVFDYIVPFISATAYADGDSQQRTLGGHGYGLQGGLEMLELCGFEQRGPELAAEAVQLLHAPNCPEGRMDVVLMPDQMILQIHESIGHPLELDRILGDERNYAGTSFVTLDMFGSYQYGSELLNVCIDPTQSNEFANYAFDDEGMAATKTYLIEQGRLVRGLGGILSQARTGLAATATSRAQSWKRPPIDRMANLNVEAGNSRFEDLIAQVDYGVLMSSNRSWSIDDSRNKFQFGCEWGRLIEQGKLTHVVKNPNYRGISATFWRNLKGVGNANTFEVLGLPSCGKGEPNQIMRVGHAAPACLFADVDVFGGT
jgi:predicted Zn-dependent protease